MSHQTNMTDYLSHFIQGLIAGDVDSVVISPGSRSTPLALLLHRSSITTYIAVDERSAGFFALGLSKTKRKPVALLCTSGTASANYYPAICEAQESQIPLIILTTDRPHELRQVGAPQAMDQLNLFQGHVKLFIEMALPEATPTMLNYAYWQGVRSVQTAGQTPVGPVHLNFPLREPLLPNLESEAQPIQRKQFFQGRQQLTHAQLEILASSWSQKRGLLIVGGSQTPAEALAFIQLAEALGWPIISDPLANILTCGQQSNTVIAHTDLFIQALPDLQPEVIVQFGLLPISKNLMIWLSQLDFTQTDRYFIDENGQWQEQLKQAQFIIQADEQGLIESLLKTDLIPAPSDWLDHWKKAESVVQQLLLDNSSQLTEANASLLVHQTMATNGQLFVANSMPIRYLDRYMTPRKSPYTLYGNRGINGIDGIVSTALGMTASHPTAQNVLLVGDLTLYHDMNGLLLAKKYQLPLTIVLLNNNGGGIFSFLSQNQLTESDFEPLFGTPLDLEFSLVADLYKGNYQRVTSLNELEQLLKTPTDSLRLLEIQTDRQDNLHELQGLSAAIKQQLGTVDD